jgi:hypothetical protein
MTARRPTIVATSIGYQLAGRGALDWRLHGIGPAMHAAWQAGVVLMGVSPRRRDRRRGSAADSVAVVLTSADRTDEL